ncbi:MAG TPA: alpha/beta hydrolase [Rhizomicrobium sp.]|nr:alpha/beta hydrolase [Rhizomicrobium sp.]
MTAKRPDLVFIHGAFCGPWAFDDFRKPFEAAGYRVHAPALRHHGEGAKPSRALGQTSLTDYADDLAKLIAGLAAPPILIGHSLGGLLAQMLAAKGLARALVLLAPCPPWGILPSTMFEIASAQTMWLAGDFWNQPLTPDYGIAAANSLDRLTPAERHKVFARFVPESGLATFEIMQWALDAKRAAEVKAEAVTCPVLCLVGRDDKINPPSTVRRIAERYKARAVFEELAGHSHWLIGEPGWEKIAGRVLTWIGAISSPPSPSQKASKARRSAS